MKAFETEVTDLRSITDKYAGYTNLPLANVNDHVVRVGIMTDPYIWHFHPNSDETFLVLEGSVIIDLEETSIEILPFQLYTVPKNMVHRTRPGGARSVNLTFESANLITVEVIPKDKD